MLKLKRELLLNFYFNLEEDFHMVPRISFYIIIIRYNSASSIIALAMIYAITDK